MLEATTTFSVATVKLPLGRNPTKMEEKGQRYNIARLRNPDVNKNVSIAVKKKICTCMRPYVTLIRRQKRKQNQHRG